MANVESMREFVSGSLTEDLHQRRTAEGWRLSAVEWQREARASGSDAPRVLEEVPFGLRISNDGLHLEQEPAERRVLMLVLELIVGDHPLSQVAEELNRQGFRTRGGSPWTRAAVFDLHPRLIEVFPRILASKEWGERKAPLA